jgi:hypothetical protein
MAMFFRCDLDNFNFMQYVKVDKSMVDNCKKEILAKLNDKKELQLCEYHYELRNYRLVYNKDNAEQQFKKFVDKISYFMAMQEALMNLVHEGLIIPLSSRNMVDNSICINYESSQGMSTRMGIRHINLPIIPYQSFMLVPSEAYK